MIHEPNVVGRRFIALFRLVERRLETLCHRWSPTTVAQTCELIDNLQTYDANMSEDEVHKIMFKQIRTL